MKILSAEQIRQADAHTIRQEPIASIDLMERAAGKCTDWIIQQPFASLPFAVTIFCGPGNNGGDGLAIARLLAEKEISIRVFILDLTGKFSNDFTVNRERLTRQGKAQIQLINNSAENLIINNSDLVIDAIFGSGLNKPVTGVAADVIRKINASGCRVIAIDVPSGLNCDGGAENKKDAIVRASHTLTFQSPKISFLFAGNFPYTGDFTVLDIGLDEKFIRSLPSKDFYCDRSLAASLYRPRKKFSHKGSFGHSLLVGGSYGKMGAAILAAKACLRAGTGLLTCHIPASGYDSMQTSVPEAMVLPDSSSDSITDPVKLDNFDAIGIGPGLGTLQVTRNILKLLIQNSPVPLVLDADALNILGENKTWLSFLPAGSILTPHPREFERLTGMATTDHEQYKLAKEFSFKHNVFTVLKGAHTMIACPDGEVYFNSTGNPGLAKGGSGDVLTGILTALIAQGYSPKEACILGVYLHGLSADIVARHIALESIMARDVTDALGEAILELVKKQ